MYINVNGVQVWKDENTTHEIKTNDINGNVIETKIYSAVIRETGKWIKDGNVEMLIAPTIEWVSENQPVIEKQPKPPTTDEKLDNLIDILVTKGVLKEEDKISITTNTL